MTGITDKDAFFRALARGIEQTCVRYVQGALSHELMAAGESKERARSCRETEREFEAAAWKILFEAKESFEALHAKAEGHRAAREKSAGQLVAHS